VRREALANDLWPDADWSTGRPRLNTVLYRLRRQIEPCVETPTFVVTPNSAEVAFNADADHWLDVDAFDAVATELVDRPQLTDEEGDRLAEAVLLYEGELCESLDAEWLVADRARLASLHMAGLTALAFHHLRRDRPDHALVLAQQGLDREPLRDDLCRLVMRCHAAAGRRSLALAAFERCKSRLADELDIDPLPETTRLAAMISRGDDPGGPALQSAAAALETLARVRRHMADLLDDVDRAIAALHPPP
jgi:DNA-binding SARP family transcriptional activator